MKCCKKNLFKLRGKLRRKIRSVATSGNYGYSAEKTLLRAEIEWLQKYGMHYMQTNPEKMLDHLIGFNNHLLNLSIDYSKFLGTKGSFISDVG